MSAIKGLKELLGPNRLNCVDVGARGGAQAHWQIFADLIELDAFEPDMAACAEQQKMARANEHWHAAGLSDRDGTATLYVTKKPSSSSLFAPNEAIMTAYVPRGYGALDRTVDVPVARLSTVLAAAGRPAPDLIKLDVQGAELDVLRGFDAKDWGNLLALQVEVEFVEQYLKQPLFWDVDRYIRERGYIMFDVLVNRYYRVKDGIENFYMKKYLGISRNRLDVSRRILSGDALYLRAPESILESGDKVGFAKMFIIFCIYRCFDEALWFVEQGLDMKIIDTAQFDECVAIVKSMAPRPTWRQRADWLGKFTRRWAKRLGIGNRRKADFWLDRSWDY